ncbi:aminodeoxychorismate synthase component I [Flavobacterium caeni]|uniref:Para-aminobenzoate synthetase component 1 n=1 Tax=Flavobacterium caeni TaxID=490189 RepID=A0A1G5B510_9FLAO|nr:aminodeoxychorismate synthase component I [Flavobacterium caeni]SCX85191.1 para-aminobenzoate synthetase component 1 [Flavobacterium caeni]
MRTSVHKKIENPEVFKIQLLLWASSFREAVFLDSNNYPQYYGSFDCVLAADALTSIQTDFSGAFEDLKQYQQITQDWLFGYLSYDLKNDTEALQSRNFDGLGFPDLFFFQPKKLFLLRGDDLQICYLNLCDDEVEADFAEITECVMSHVDRAESLQIEQRISQSEYLSKVGQMLEHIHRGDIYEANFCMEFFAHGAIDPVATFQQLNAISTPPFAAFVKNHQQFLCSASPERYLRKQQDKIISQPIKGTAKRSADPAEDAAIQQALLLSEKERAENIMIVDLVRNDLSRTATKGSVAVEELCGAYTFKQVHHLISTVVSKVDRRMSVVEVIKDSFPMGSMTGAPKISAMQIIEKLETTKRGLYSGAVGYFTPDGDFDFNVVIRSILYDAQKQYVSFSVGSAITAESSPESEYEECLLKARAMRTVLA